jgi:hypothetical protein
MKVPSAATAARRGVRAEAMEEVEIAQAVAPSEGRRAMTVESPLSSLQMR